MLFASWVALTSGWQPFLAQARLRLHCVSSRGTRFTSSSFPLLHVIHTRFGPQLTPAECTPQRNWIPCCATRLHIPAPYATEFPPVSEHHRHATLTTFPRRAHGGAHGYRLISFRLRASVRFTWNIANLQGFSVSHARFEPSLYLFKY